MCTDLYKVIEEKGLKYLIDTQLFILVKEANDNFVFTSENIDSVATKDDNIPLDRCVRP